MDFKKVFSLKNDQASVDVVKKRVVGNATVTGTNMYVLIFAILIASIGLNVNSTPVVIGAMLISPLINVITYIALAVADYDFKGVRDGFIKFAFQLSVSVVTSYIYFSISPVSTFSRELFARTQPTFFDVLIAICGGATSIIANTRKNTVSNIIPGVAIATALMPPVCTAGYCLAIGEWGYALRAFYLFLINSVFICGTSILGFYLMGFTKREKLVHTRKKVVTVAVSLIILIIPSVIMGRNILSTYNINENFKNYIKQDFSFENAVVVESGLDMENKKITVALLGEYVPEEKIEEIKADAKKFDLQEYKVNVKQVEISKNVSAEVLKYMIQNEEKTDFVRPDNEIDLVTPENEADFVSPENEKDFVKPEEEETEEVKEKEVKEEKPVEEEEPVKEEKSEVK